jgi:putative tryptophan/tyrosine transport system substrate-binding protein
MNRRQVIAAFGGAAVWPVAARAQQRRLPVVGYLHAISVEALPSQKKAFVGGLAEMGFVEGRDIVVEYRSADGQYDRLPALAADLVQRQVDVIACGGGSTTALVAKASTRTIPLVVLSGSDPIRLGLVESLSRPGGNITGVSQIVTALDGKRLELLRELVGGEGKIGYLVNPANPNTPRMLDDMAAAARPLPVELAALRAGSDAEIDAAFASARHGQIKGLIVGADPFFVARREVIASLAAREAVPTIYFFREFVDAGGLLSYGTDVRAAYRQMGVYAGRILKGAKPSDLPMVEISERVELVVNLKTAKALGVAIPQNIMIRADEVIE